MLELIGDLEVVEGADLGGKSDMLGSDTAPRALEAPSSTRSRHG